MFKNIIIIITHFILAVSLTLIVLFSNKITTLLLVLLAIFIMILFMIKCKDCPVFQIESNYKTNSSTDIVGSFVLGKDYQNVSREMFTMFIIYLSFTITLFKILGVIIIKYLKR